VSRSVRRDEVLDALVRSGPLPSQAASSYELAAGAVREGRFGDAEELGRFTVEEAREGRELYPVFAERIRDFLRREEVPADRLEREEARVRGLLRLPGGEEFDLERGWDSYVGHIEDFARACRRERAAEALAELERARRSWRETHDRACDLVCGLLDASARLLGETRIGEVWDHVMASIYPSRDRYDVRARPWRESIEPLVLDAATSLRGHLSGPGRAGAVEVEEHADRWVVRFDPCGSGGRTYLPDAEEGTPPRTEPPFGFAVTTEEHDWAWNAKGVCLYCAHCCQLQQRIPIRRLGYPVRVVDPPRWPAEGKATCTWSIYKDPSLVPEEAYRSVGERPPEGQPPAR